MEIWIIYYGLRLWRLGFIDESITNGSAEIHVVKVKNIGRTYQPLFLII